MEEFTVPGFSFDVGSPPESLVGDPGLMHDFWADSLVGIHQNKGRQSTSVAEPAVNVRKSEAPLRFVNPETWPKPQQPLHNHNYQQQILQLYQSRIPTPMSSPRPIRARRGSLISSSAYLPDAGTTSNTSYLSSSSLPSPSSSSTAPSSPEKECNFLKPKEVFRVCRTKSVSPGKVNTNTKAGTSPRRPVSNGRRSSSTSRVSNSITASTTSVNNSCSRTSTRRSNSSGRDSTKNTITNGRETIRTCSRVNSGSSSSKDRENASSCGKDNVRNSTSSSSDTLSPSSPASSNSCQTVLFQGQGRGRGARPKTSSSPASSSSSTIITTTFCVNCRTLSKSRSPSSSSSSSRDRGSNSFLTLSHLWPQE